MILRLASIALLGTLLWRLPQSPPPVVVIMPPASTSAAPTDVVVAHAQINRQMADRILDDPDVLLREPRMLTALGFAHHDVVDAIDELSDRLVFTVQRGDHRVWLVVFIEAGLPAPLAGNPV